MSTHLSAGWKATPNLSFVVLVEQGILRLSNGMSIACGDELDALEVFGESEMVENDPAFFYYPHLGLMFTVFDDVISSITLDLTSATFTFERTNGHPIKLDTNTTCEEILQTFPNPENEDIHEYEDVIETTFNYVKSGLFTAWVFDNGRLADITFELE